MKFRRLTIEELQGLEQEFVQFLAANTITGSDWAKLKEHEIEKANELIDVFSDLVFEKIIKDVLYLEFRTEKDIKTFHCQEDKIVLIGLQHKKPSTIDLSDEKQLKKAIEDASSSLQIYFTEKVYTPNRALELFRMLEHGAVISKNGELFKALESLR